MQLQMDENTKKKYLKNIEEDIQKTWHDRRIFKTEEISDKPKFFITVPYPYMNGRLHLGHAFTISKAEFTAVYKKMCNYNINTSIYINEQSKPNEC